MRTGVCLLLLQLSKRAAACELAAGLGTGAARPLRSSWPCVSAPACLLLLAAAVQRNREGLGNVVKQLQAQLEAQQKALAAFQQQYKIRVGQPGEGGSDDGGPGGKPAGSKPSSSGTAGKGAAGVLC